jgi:hypothetical protein
MSLGWIDHINPENFSSKNNAVSLNTVGIIIFTSANRALKLQGIDIH